MEDGFKEYEDKLLQYLLQLCTERGLLDGQLIISADVEERWPAIGREYAGDAVKEFNQYPEVVLAWAAYMGMAVASWWDTDWIRYKDCGYEYLVGERGFDDLDEHITRDILKHPLNSKAAADLAANLSFLATEANSFLRHQKAESQSIEGFKMFVHSLSAMYKIGASIQLKALGYKLQPINFN